MLNGAHGFARLRVVEIGDSLGIAAAQAAGVRAAAAPIVVFGEDHAFPEPGWAAALIAAHRGPWTAVGPAMKNANPDTWTSRADFLLGFGRWRSPATAGPTDHLPGHNSSYKRETLLSYGPDLVERLQLPALLHADLVSRGLRLYLEPGAVVSHINFGDRNVWFRLRFHSGRGFAAAKSREWTRLQRGIYAMATPLIPFVRFVRIGLESHRPGDGALMIKIAPMLFAGLVIDAAGELVGCLRGVPRTTSDPQWEYEFRRERFQ